MTITNTYYRKTPFLFFYYEINIALLILYYKSVTFNKKFIFEVIYLLLSNNCQIQICQKYLKVILKKKKENGLCDYCQSHYRENILTSYCLTVVIIIKP